LEEVLLTEGGDCLNCINNKDSPGGLVLFNGLDKHTLTMIQGSSIEASIADDPVAALTHFAERV
jgi:hypothetical protein